jgi:DNA-binding NtrC family response regulator
MTKILAVDDGERIRGLLSTGLSRNWYHLFTVNHGPVPGGRE